MLFDPIHIASMQLRNRLVMSPMETLYATKDGVPSSRTVAYYEARARGGVGLITLGACTVDDAHREVRYPAPGKAFFGQDAHYAGNAPRYRDLGDGTVLDLVTRLMWQKTPDAKGTYAQLSAGANLIMSEA